jgi:hypothetical protein
MNRRGLLSFGLGMTASALLGQRSAMADLEPDGLWLTYRRFALFIVGQRVDETANAVVGVLARALPKSRARLALAADTRRIGVLIGTNQQDVAVMDLGHAEALFLAKPPFADIRDLHLRTIVAMGTHVMVCRSDFPSRLAFQMAQALVGNGASLPAPAQVPAGVIPVHPGSRAFFAGETMPT